jgi:hypothetical protein
MLTAGWALTQNFYLVGSISGVNDLFYDSLLGESENGKGGGIGIYMYGIGARYYPLANKKHLQLGLDLGPSGMAIVRYAGLDNEESHESWGFSTRFSVGWDFDSTMTGFGAILGADIMFNTIDGDTSLFSGLFFKLLFK